MSLTSAERLRRIFAIIPSSAMMFMDQSILPVALPVIQKEFGSSATSLQWAVNAYLLSWTVFVLLAGKIGDRIGHRVNYLWGMSLFALFSLLCGMSQSGEFLIGARALQGLAGAMLGPSQTALISTSFPSVSRGRAVGIIASIGSISLILGPLIGGILTEWLSWRWIFWINLPIAALGIFLTILVLPKSPKREGKIDFLGFIYFALFSFFSTLVFMQGTSWGWGSRRVLAAGIVAFIAAILLLRREKTSRNPFITLTLFKRPIFASINVSIAISQFILMITVFRTIYTETILGYTPTQTGIITAFSSVPVFFFSYVGGFLSDKVSPKLPIALGYCLIILSFFWLGNTPMPTLILYLIPLFFFGMGLPLIFTPSYTVAMSDIPEEQLGIAFGIVSMLRVFAGTIGLALIFAFTSWEKAIYLPNVGERIAEMMSFSSVHFLLGILMVIAFLVSAFLYHRKSTHHLPSGPAEGWD